MPRILIGGPVLRRRAGERNRTGTRGSRQATAPAIYDERECLIARRRLGDGCRHGQRVALVAEALQGDLTRPTGASFSRELSLFGADAQERGLPVPGDRKPSALLQGVAAFVVSRERLAPGIRDDPGLRRDGRRSRASAADQDGKENERTAFHAARPSAGTAALPILEKAAEKSWHAASVRAVLRSKMAQEAAA